MSCAAILWRAAPLNLGPFTVEWRAATAATTAMCGSSAASSRSSARCAGTRL